MIDYKNFTAKEIKTLEEVKMFAIRFHGLQDYDGFPYHKHLIDVESLVLRFSNDFDLHIAAWLHDILEDCPVSYNDIKSKFGERVAEIVYAVTDELGRNRKERKEKTYPKIKSNNDAVLIKICDRIANIENCILTNNSMLKAYKKEHENFVMSLKSDGVWDDAWNYLENVISESLINKI
jgi:guanosine-3',5'-bis(diphosphate) 3'-pyrophosphohydrolase